MGKLTTSIALGLLAAGSAAAVAAGLSAAGQFDRVNEGNGRPHTLLAKQPDHGKSPVTNSARAVAPRAVSDDDEEYPVLYGCAYYSTGMFNPRGLYKLPTEEYGDFDLVIKNVVATAGVEREHVYYATEWLQMSGGVNVALSAFDMMTGLKTFNYYLTQEFAPLDLALDPTDNTIYGSFFNAGSGYRFGTVDYDTYTAETTTIRDLGNTPFQALACDSQGQLYGIVTTYEYGTPTGSDLVKIDKATGEYTTVGPTGYIPAYITSATIDPETDRMFWTVSPPDETGILTEVDLTTGKATLICRFQADDEVTGLVVPQKFADDLAPAVPEFLEISFEEGDFSGTVSFTSPYTLYNGDDADGELTYSIYIDGELEATGATAYGEDVVETMHYPYRGEHNFTVSVSNEVGMSPKAGKSVFVGPGEPAVPVAKLRYADGMMTLNWEAVDRAVDGGYLNSADVKYDVTRFPGRVSVLRNSSELVFSEPVAEPEECTAYYYTVTPVNKSVRGREGISNTVVLGANDLPYACGFDNTDDLDSYTIIDANGDGIVWTQLDGEANVHYNRYEAMDDWLITPPMRFEGGKTYIVTFKAISRSVNFAETFDVWYGFQPTVEDMEFRILDDTSVFNETKDIRIAMTPAESSTYYIGIHGKSEANTSDLYIDDLRVSNGLSGDVPAAVTVTEAKGADYGSLQAWIDVKLPENDFAGMPLTALSHIKVTENGAEALRVENVEPGQELHLEVPVAERGLHQFAVNACCGDKVGEETLVSAFVGIQAPVEVENARIVETEDNNMLEVSWDAVTRDVSGILLDSGQVRYTVVDQTTVPFTVVAEAIAGTSCQYEYPTDKQSFVSLVVYAETDWGRSKDINTPATIVGPAYDGFNESFAGGKCETAWQRVSINQGLWGAFSDDQMSDIDAVDGDGGFAVHSGSYIGNTGGWLSGKIDTSNLLNPGLTFYVFNHTKEEDINEIWVGVREIGEDDFTEVLSSAVCLLSSEGGWNKVTVPLTEWRGKTIQLLFKAVTQRAITTAIDQVMVRSLVMDELEVKKVSARSHVFAGKPFDVSVEVSNNGSGVSSDYSVEIVCKNQVLATASGVSIASGNRHTFTIPVTVTALCNEDLECTARVNMVSDEVPYNNELAFEVGVMASHYPSVEMLEAVSDEGTANMLTWQSPDMLKATGEPETETFEEAEPFATTYGDWVFVDGDESPIGGFSDLSFPIEYMSLQSFWIHDRSWKYNFMDSSFDPVNGGVKYLASLYRDDFGTVDDWAISPELPGCEQLLTFWARSYLPSYPETIEVLWSDGSTDTGDFELLARYERISSAWTCFEVRLPQGARRFAIRSCGTDTFFLMVDDVEFISEDGIVSMTHAGYRVYRDGEHLADLAKTETTYIDSDAPAGQHIYAVTALYDLGESAPAEVAVTTGAGVENISDATRVVVSDQRVRVIAPQGTRWMIAAVDGTVVASGVVAGETVVELTHGIYTVNANGQIHKILVK